MVKTAGPDLKRYMDKRLSLKLNGNRKVSGVLRGFDQFMNVTLDETVEEVSATESNRIGMVVIRGNSIVQFECLERFKLLSSSSCTRSKL
ncbi:LSM domain [Phytophthora cactorum]|nr:LSM domain [Phytophthora cactorum]